MPRIPMHSARLRVACYSDGMCLPHCYGARRPSGLLRWHAEQAHEKHRNKPQAEMINSEIGEDMKEISEIRRISRFF